MTLNTGTLIINHDNGNQYELKGAVRVNKEGYRHVYSTLKHHSQDGAECTDEAWLIVYDKSQLPQQLSALPEREYFYLTEVKSHFMPRANSRFESELDDGTKIEAIEIDAIAGQTLEAAVESGEIDAQAASDIAAKLVIALNDLWNVGSQTTHYNLNPSDIYLTQLAPDQSEIDIKIPVLGAFNFVSREPRTDTLIDKKQMCHAYSAPETTLKQYSPLCAQFSLAAVIVYTMRGSHPWALGKEAYSYSAFKKMKSEKPRLDGVAPAIAKVLAKALSFGKHNRYATMYDFAKALAESGAIRVDYLDQMFERKPERNQAAEPPLATTATMRHDRANESEDTEPQQIQTRIEMRPRVGDGFKAVAGMSQLKDDLTRDFIDIVNNKELANEFGLKIPGMVMYGPPGTGKTYIAERLAEELGIDFSLISPSDLGSSYLHGSQLLIKDLFDKARKRAHDNKKGVLIVVDEIDAVAPTRMQDRDGHRASEVAELLAQLNKAADEGVYVIGTTNCLDNLDRAVIRTGRLDKVVYVGLPDDAARKELFEYELSKRPCGKDIDSQRLAELTDGYTSSDISYIVQESARVVFSQIIKSASKEHREISQSTIEGVIAHTRPSVTAGDIAHYEMMRDRYVTGKSQQHRPYVGFVNAD